MKTLLESILDNTPEDTLDQNQNKPQKQVSFKNFKGEVEEILRDKGFSFTKKDKASQTNPTVFYHSVHSSELDGPLGGHDGMVDVYILHYGWDNDYTKRYGHMHDEDSFKLVLYIWNDKTEHRPRYYFKDFQLHLPSTKNKGYSVKDEWKKFGSIKTTPEYYNRAIRHISAVVSAFLNGRQAMDIVWGKGNNPQKNDFNKVCKLAFGSLIQDM